MKIFWGVHALRIALRITMLALLMTHGAGAAKITVNASGGGDYTRIQDAIDNASAGDTILVYSGFYYENVNVTKQLNLHGIGNPVVDAGGGKSAITLAADGIILEGFTATGSGVGAGVTSGQGITVTSSNNILSGNNASKNDIGISLSYSSNNTLTGNNANSNRFHLGKTDLELGTGISLSYSSNNTLIDNNASSNGFGISLFDSSNNILSGNNASKNDKGIRLSNSRNNTLTGNNANSNNFYFRRYGYNFGYGIGLDFSSFNNTLIDNNASSNGLGFGLSNSRNNTLIGNNASNNDKGIRLSNSRNNKIYNNIFNNIFNNIITTNNFNFYYSNHINTWNTTKTSGTNIIEGPYLGGNFWANPSGTGFSQTCADTDKDGICDSNYTLDSGNVDYLPLTIPSWV